MENKNLYHLQTFEQFSQDYENELNEGIFGNKAIEEIKKNDIEKIEDIEKTFKKVFDVKPKPEFYSQEFTKKKLANALKDNNVSEDQMKDALKQAKDYLEKNKSLKDVVPVIQKDGSVKLKNVEKGSPGKSVHAQRGGK